MKKQLLSLAFAAALLPAFNASAEPALTEVWKYETTELNDGWDGTNPNWDNPGAIKSKPCPRFATAKDGKIYTVNMMTMSIAEITPDGMVDRYKLPSLAGVSVDGIADYYGTSISRDDAGNFIVGHLFTKAPQSALRWTIFEPATGKYKHFTLNVPDGMTIKRADCVGRAIGDVTRNGFLYLAPDAFVTEGTHTTNQKVRILHFTGDGDIEGVTLEDSWSPMVYLSSKSTWNTIAQPKYANITEALANPVNSGFYTSSAWYSSTTYKPAATYFGFTAAGAEDWGLSGFGTTYNAGTNGFDTFVLDGQRYYVRNNIDGECRQSNANTMNIAVYDASFNMVAKWENPDYSSNYGYSSIIAEPIDGETAYICVYNCTSNMNPVFDAAGTQTNTKTGGAAAAVLKFTTATAEEGSEKNPYKISTAADLCDMHNKIVGGKKVYFVLENDIDMAGVTDYVPAIGSDGATYAGEFDFDGQCHVIKNFAPEAKYSYMSVFGVIRGNVKNLGIENCNIVSNSLGAGALGGYGSQGGIDCVIDNVWATGSVKGESVYAGGLVGTNGNNLTITNSYFNGTVEGTYAGGLVGRGRAGITIKNSYAAGAVTATTKAGGVAGTDKDASVAIALENVIAWNTTVTAPAADAVTLLGHADATGVQVWEGMKVNDVAVTDGVAAADLIAAATSWEAYNKELINGYPALAWQEILAPAGSEANPYKISTAADLCDMHNKIVDGKKVYFVLENDIDMAGVTDYVPAIGSDGATYVGEFDFDGQCHVIKNFAPEAKYSYMSVFGVIRGNVKNLGIENCNIVSNSLGAGALGGYGSQGGIDCVIDNVWATGSVKGESVYAGGLVGTNGNNLTITNSYFNGTVEGTYAGGLVGRGRAGITIKNSYAAGAVTATTKAGGVAGTDKDASVAIALENVIAWNTTVTAPAADAVTPLGHADATGVQVWEGMKVNDVAVEGGKSAIELQIASAAWTAYKNLINGYPALAWQNATEEVPFPGCEANPYKVAVAADLTGLAAAINKDEFYVEFVDDIDMEGVTFTPIDAKKVLHVDGKGHVVRNLSVTGAKAAMFLDFKGSIKNLGIENAAMVAEGWGTAGTFIAYALNEAVVENCYATGSVSGFYAGGIAAGVQSAGKLTVRNCYSAVNATSPNGWAGGLVGPTNETGTLVVENCYASGRIDGALNGGGIVAGANTNYANPCNVTLTNVVAWNSEVVKGEAIVPAASVLNATVTDALVWDGMKVNGAAVEGAKTAYELQVVVTGWEAFNDKLKDGMPVLAWQEATEDVVDPDAEDGSEANPYKISTAADLCDMHNKIVDGKKVYFVLENDIDMAGVTDYVPAIGSDGKTYEGEFDFDGQCHVIKNFAPEAKYSYMSVFGVIRGNVKNLGIENCNIVSNSLGAGALGGYGSQGGVDCVIDNVWATGSVKCSAYAGGLVGTNGNNLTITNSYFNGTVEGTYAGGLVGRGRAGITIKNSYAAGAVTATTKAGGVAGTDKDASVAIALENVIAWNTSVTAPAADAVTLLGHADATGVQVWEGMKVNDVAVTDGVAASVLENTAMSWEAYADYLVNGMPALKWQPKGEGDGVEGIDADNADVAPVYYNLQGVQVENPAAGLYIVKRGNKVTKEIIR